MSIQSLLPYIFTLIAGGLVLLGTFWIGVVQERQGNETLKSIQSTAESIKESQNFTIGTGGYAYLSLKVDQDSFVTALLESGSGNIYPMWDLFIRVSDADTEASFPNSSVFERSDRDIAQSNISILYPKEGVSEANLNWQIPSDQNSVTYNIYLQSRNLILQNEYIHQRYILRKINEKWVGAFVVIKMNKDGPILPELLRLEPPDFPRNADGIIDFN